jgi:uncharacterized protein
MRQPRTWLALIAGLGLFMVLDSFRNPTDQVTGWAYVRAVRAYQALGRPLLREHVQCRYCPSCSDYSIEAVETHGIRRGLSLTYQRLCSCQDTVPPGTSDPVPP